MDELKVLIRDLNSKLDTAHQDSADLRSDVDELQASNESLHTSRTWLIAALGGVVVALAVAAFFIVQSARYATCSTSRVNALSGPGNERVAVFFKAYTEAAGQIDHKLTDQERAAVLAELDRDRADYNLIPKHPALMKLPDGNLLAIRDLIVSLRANAKYQAVSAAHPVCSLWDVF